MRQTQGSLVSIQERTEEAIDFLRMFEPTEGYFVGFSGGKDSIVSLELCRMAGVKHQAFYSCTRIDPPEIVRFIRTHYPDVAFLYPKRTFWDGIRVDWPPLRMWRWCCDHLKEMPSADITLKTRVFGLRAEESARRAMRPRVDRNERIGQTIIKPVFGWREWQIWDFIESRKLPYPSLYDEGWGRVGCVVCPQIMYLNSRQLERNRSRWPQIYRVFERVAREWYEASGRANKEARLVTFEAWLAAYYRGFDGPEDRPIAAAFRQDQHTLEGIFDPGRAA